MKIFSIAQVVFAVCLLSMAGVAQRNLQAGPAVTENFDSLGISAGVSVTNNVSPIVGLYTFRTNGDTNPKTFFASTGGSAGADTYNYGTTGVGPLTDRALGAITGAGTGNIYYGLRFVNSGSIPITSISVGYTGEHWRDQNANESIMFDYRVSSTAITDLISGTYTNVAGLTYVHNNPAGTNNALDGNAAANRQVIAPVNILLSTPLLPGHNLMLRWTDFQVGGNNDGLAIDDVSVSVIGVTAAKASISGRVTDAYGRAISNATITTTDLSGTSMSVYTNTFGYFSVKDLEAGQAYLLTISSRRYTFANPTRLIELSDNIDNLDFVANR